MNTERTITEGLPRISFSRDAHYARPRCWELSIVKGLLTNKRIAYWQRRGFYQRSAFRQSEQGDRLVYSC